MENIKGSYVLLAVRVISKNLTALEKQKTFFFPCRYDYLEIVDDNDRVLGTYCGSELSGKVVLVTGNYALIIFHSDEVEQYLGFQLTILFTENQNGMFR